MTRAGVLGLVVTAAVIAGLTGQGPEEARACSWYPLRLEQWAEVRPAPVIAVVTVSEATENVATMEVEEYWAGSVREPVLQVNNHAVLCPGGIVLADEGWRYEKGDRLVVVLSPDGFGLADWMEAGFERTSTWEIHGERLIADGPGGLAPPDGPNPVVSTLDEAKELVSGAAEQQPFAPVAAPTEEGAPTDEGQLYLLPIQEVTEDEERELVSWPVGLGLAVLGTGVVLGGLWVARWRSGQA